MSLKVFNTATGRKEVFRPVEDGKVGMYVCGVTPYDLSHVGHGRSYVAFDVIRRVLEYLGFDVNYVQNFTDVDDKIIARAREEGVDALRLSERYIRDYFVDLDALGVKRADAYPRVSEKIPEIIEAVKSLVEKGAAYEAGGSVYLDVMKSGDYGKLSGQPIEDLLAGARVKVDENKKNPLDFALWKNAKHGEISWGSPWGRGRPGWHIECSVMGMELLGPTLDIHGGGQDLVFPHHENEIAQSEALTGVPFARYWLHNGLVTVDGEKMSKSLGNFITIRELRRRFDPRVLRFFLLSAHYRRPLDFSLRAVEDAGKGFMRLQNTLYNIGFAAENAADSVGDGFRKETERVKKEFVDALEDDFNVPRALAVLFDFVRSVNVYIGGKPSKKGLVEAASTIKELTGVLGLSFEEDVPELVKELVELFIKVRAELRNKKDYAASDSIRESLLDLGIVVEDRGGVTRWRFASPSGSEQ